VLRASTIDGDRDVVRQQFTFSPPGTTVEREEYAAKPEGVMRPIDDHARDRHADRHRNVEGLAGWLASGSEGLATRSSLPTETATLTGSPSPRAGTVIGAPSPCYIAFPTGFETSWARPGRHAARLTRCSGRRSTHATSWLRIILCKRGEPKNIYMRPGDCKGDSLLVRGTFRCEGSRSHEALGCSSPAHARALRLRGVVRASRLGGDLSAQAVGFTVDSV
jgi:hypothetical protein